MYELFGIVWFVGIAIGIATALVHIAFAVAVYFDARLLMDSDKLRPVMVPGEVWAIATLLGGVFAAVGYWIIHRSSIAKLDPMTSEFDIKDYLS